MRHALFLVAVIPLILFAERGLAAGKITSVAVNPSTLTAGATTMLTIGHAGEKCGYLVLTGTGANVGPFSVGGAGTNFPVTYPNQGTFTLQVVGKKKNNHPKCKVLAPPVTVVVQAPNGRTGGNPLGRTPAKKLKHDNPGLMEAGKAKPMVPPPPPIQGVRPKIESAVFVQGPLGFASPGILAPSGKLIVRGEYFGSSKGELYLEVKGSEFPEYPSGKVPLGILSWKKDRVEGTIPTGMTKPMARANVEVRLRNATNALSNGFDREFQVPVETRILKHTDPGVRLLKCSNYGTTNDCLTWTGYTLSGYHFNAWGASGDGPGTDEFEIKLQDGWVFSRIVEFEKNVTGNDGDYIKPMNPALPIGSDFWRGKIKTNATSDDSVRYRIRIEVKRAKGAY